MKNLEYYLHCFTHLRRAPINGGAPHKPILLLSVIDCIERGYINCERIYITPELIASFKSNWIIWVHTVHTMKFTLPFYHMSSEPFWELITKTGYEIALTRRNSVKSFNTLNTAVNYALIDKALFLLLLQEKERSILKQVLITKYFPTVEPIVKNNIPYLDTIAQDILNDSAVQYRKKIADIQQSEDQENYEEEVYLRNSVFKKYIPMIYNNTCCITGLKINSLLNISMIDACHIVPFSENYDDTIGNGLALCPNFHRAFDRGLVTIDENYRVVISDKFKEETECSYSISQFLGKPILLPQKKLFYPKKENLIWHNENVFR
ncbi:HNH endonuclease [Dysgonomonas sp. ZJ279]|uniref:HNH endonuclease n=1 Tax=Dysgonomonas sp. ZJ279 TaxID=2709796 RepID=UPI0013EAB55C|nr:HNH endonuclease [Dysgonomonas sp. ZJ279]